jgi:hypothetical protein
VGSSKNDHWGPPSSANHGWPLSTNARPGREGSCRTSGCGAALSARGSTARWAVVGSERLGRRTFADRAAGRVGESPEVRVLKRCKVLVSRELTYGAIRPRSLAAQAHSAPVLSFCEAIRGAKDSDSTHDRISGSRFHSRPGKSPVFGAARRALRPPGGPPPPSSLGRSRP